MIVYIRNRIPHRALGKITLEEVFIGKKLEVRDFNIFSNITYFHVPYYKCTKLD